MMPFLMKKVFYISRANFILGSNKTIITVLILIISKLILKATKVINKIE